MGGCRPIPSTSLHDIAAYQRYRTISPMEVSTNTCSAKYHTIASASSGLWRRSRRHLLPPLLLSWSSSPHPFGCDGFPSPPPLLPRSRARRCPRPEHGATFVIGDDRGNDFLTSCCWGGGPLRRRRRVHAIAGTDHWRGSFTTATTTTTMQGRQPSVIAVVGSAVWR